MNHYPKSLQNLIRTISRLPGIGQKTAERLAMHLLRAPRGEAEELARAILDLKERIRFCDRCFGLSDAPLCRLCADPARNGGLLCVVEQPGDMMAVEKSGAFRGLYHILHGVLSPMNGVGPEQLRIRELMARVRDEAVEEVVLATGTNVEGEATADYLSQRLASSGVRVTRIASGVPMGGDLKYVDQVTLRRALDTRHAL